MPHTPLMHEARPKAGPRAKHIPLTEALARAVELYRHEVFLEAMSAGYAALRADPKAWAEEQAERAAWETTSADGLQNE